jgi:hypothetical protein
LKLFEWFKKTTFEGKILDEIADVSACQGYGKLQIQKLDKTIDGKYMYRINIVRTSFGSYQSLPIVLSESDLLNLASNIEKRIGE